MHAAANIASAKPDPFAAFRAIDAALISGSARLAARTPEQVDADFRAFHLNAARQLIETARKNRAWIKAVDARNPVGPSMSCFYGETPVQAARRLAEIARHRRLVAWGSNNAPVDAHRERGTWG